MKKFIAMFLCVAMMASMVVVANATTIILPAGGQLANTGCSTVYGYTDGGTESRAYMTCTIELVPNSSMGKVNAVTKSTVSMGANAYLNVVAWNNGTELDSSAKASSASTTNSFTWWVYGGSNTDEGTAGHSYSSSAYGDWICGTATN